MSKSITIQEGGVAKALTSVKKIKTAKQNGGSVYWVPEEETELTTKSISSNGTYKASSDGYYGYSQVTVNIANAGRVTGIDPDDGNEYSITTDSEDPSDPDAPVGNIVKTKLPSKIRITQNPTKMTYNDGENIDRTGMIVKAYYNDNTEWGTVTISEVNLIPTAADIDDTDSIGTIDCDGVEVQYTKHLHIVQYNSDMTLDKTVDLSANGDAIFILYASAWLAISKSADSYSYVWGEGEYRYTPTIHPGDSGTVALIAGGTPYATSSDIYSAYLLSHDWVMNPPSARTPQLDDAYPIDIGAILDGTVTTTSGTEKISVEWGRPSDNKVLKTSFEITVNAVGGENSGTGGNTGEDPEHPITPHI